VKVRAVYFEQQFKISFGFSDNKTSSKYSITEKTLQSTVSFLTIEKLHKKIVPGAQRRNWSYIQNGLTSRARRIDCKKTQVSKTPKFLKLSAFCL
jgi:hypothetical protein